jgi:transglutaminase-like putative cysteine protease
VSAWALSSRAAPARAGIQRRESLALRVLAFFAFAAFVAHEYATLLTQPPAGRLLAAAAVAAAGGAAIALSARAGRAAPLIAGLATVLALALGLIAIGVPARLLAPWRWAALERDLHQGYVGLSGWLWPYRGGERWSQVTVLALVPVVLTFAAALRFWPAARGASFRSAAALLALVALFVTGAANQVQPAWRFQGAALTLLAAAWLWLPGLPAAQLGRAGRWLLGGAVAALLVAPALEGGAPWIDYRSWNPVGVTASFQWDQVYGPIPWSRSAATMLEVASADEQPQLLRVTSLDRFDGVRFVRSPNPPGSARLDHLGADSRWLTQATITIAGLRGSQLVTAGGLPLEAQWLGAQRETMSSERDGTASFSATPREGESYRVLSYAPQPTAAVLRDAASSFPRAYLAYTRFALPSTSPAASLASNLRWGQRVAPPVTVGAPAPGRAPASDATVAQLVQASPYAPMFALARRLAAGAGSTYEIVERVLRFFARGFRYDENVPVSRYPLESFVFSERRGYCQQFSGAMTLLLRMDGVPARVAAGFKPGVYDSASSRWRVRALDAHSWVEVYFSGIGWVPFDPTPARGSTAPSALIGVSGLPSKATISGTPGAGGGFGGRLPSGSLLRPSHHATPGSSGGLPLEALLALVAGGVVALALGGVWLRGALRLRRALSGDADGAVAELRGALTRLGEPPARTLAGLEAELRGDGRGTALRYVRRLRELRYGTPGGAAPTVRGRRALRRALAARCGRWGRVRALLALPPGAARRPASPT